MMPTSRFPSPFRHATLPLLLPSSRATTAFSLPSPRQLVSASGVVMDGESASGDRATASGGWPIISPHHEVDSGNATCHNGGWQPPEEATGVGDSDRPRCNLAGSVSVGRWAAGRVRWRRLLGPATMDVATGDHGC